MPVSKPQNVELRPHSWPKTLILYISDRPFLQKDTTTLSRRLSRHRGLPSTPLDAHRKVNMTPESFRLSCGMGGEFLRKSFGNLVYVGVLLLPPKCVCIGVLLSYIHVHSILCSCCMGPPEHRWWADVHHHSGWRPEWEYLKLGRPVLHATGVVFSGKKADPGCSKHVISEKSVIFLLFRVWALCSMLQAFVPR